MGKYSYRLVVCIGLLFPFNALSGAEKSNTSEASKLYRENCAICHGDKGDGMTRANSGLRPPPRNFSTVEAALELTRQRMIDSVTNGRPGTGMMAHKDRLTPQQIASVVDYIRTNFMLTPDLDHPTVSHQKGAKIYRKTCAVCHGDKGNSAIWAQNGLNPPPRDFTTAEARQILTRDRMINSVTNGSPGTGMMPFAKKLGKEDIEAVVDYIREAFLKSSSAAASQPSAASTNQKTPKIAAASKATPPADAMHQGAAAQRGPHDPGLQNKGTPMVTPSRLPPAAPADMSIPMPKQLAGDIKAGKAFFMKNCFTCHGKTGKGDGPRAYFNIPRPRNFTSPESQQMLNRVRIFYGIKAGIVGTVMPAWGKVLSDQEIANVTEFVFQEFIQTKKNVSTDKKKAK